MYFYTHTCIHTHMHMHIHASAYIHLFKYVFTRTHRHTYTHSPYPQNTKPNMDFINSIPETFPREQGRRATRICSWETPPETCCNNHNKTMSYHHAGEHTETAPSRLGPWPIFIKIFKSPIKNLSIVGHPSPVPGFRKKFSKCKNVIEKKFC